MIGTKTAPRSSSTPAFSSSAFSPVAHSNMDNIMQYNNIQKRINQLTTIYENLKETTYKMDRTVLNMWKNWIDDKDNIFNKKLIYDTLGSHNSVIGERLQRIDNLYNLIYQLEKERDLINIEEEEQDFIDIETEDEEEEEENESEEESEEEFKSFKEIYNNEKDLIYNEGYISVYDSLNEYLLTKINFYDLKELEYTYNELIDYHDNIKTILMTKDIDETYKILYRHILDAVSFTIFINYYEECIKDVIDWKKARINYIMNNLISHIELQINNIDDVFFIVNNLQSAYKHRYIPLLKQCHNINIKNLTNYYKFKIDDILF